MQIPLQRSSRSKGGKSFGRRHEVSDIKNTEWPIFLNGFFLSGNKIKNDRQGMLMRSLSPQMKYPLPLHIQHNRMASWPSSRRTLQIPKKDIVTSKLSGGLIADSIPIDHFCGKSDIHAKSIPKRATNAPIPNQKISTLC